MFDKRALLFMTTGTVLFVNSFLTSEHHHSDILAYSVPAIFVQSAQAYFDKAVNDRFGKVKAYFFRITLCLAINVGIAASAPYWKPEVNLHLHLRLHLHLLTSFHEKPF